MRNKVRDELRQGHMKRRICLALSVLGILNAAPLLSAGAQNAAPPAQLPNLNTSSARPELQKLLEQVEAQLAERPPATTKKTSTVSSTSEGSYR